MPRKSNLLESPEIEKETPEKFFYPELLEEAKLKGNPDDYYALVYRVTPDGQAFEGRTRADLTWEEFRDTFGTGKFTFQIKHRATNAYAGQNTFRIGAPIAASEATLGGLGESGKNDIAALVRSLESLVKSLVQNKRTDVEEMLLKFAMSKLTEKQESKTLSEQIEELISLQKLIAPKKETDLLEAFDKRLNLVERIENLGKKIGTLDKSEDEFSMKDMFEIVKTFLNSNSEMPHLNGTQTLQQMPPKFSTPEMQYQKWLSKFPEQFRKGADVIAKSMVGEVNHDLFIKALKSEALDEKGEIKSDYKKFVKLIKVDSEIAIDFLKSQGFPVEKHLEWTKKALELISEQV